MSSDAGPWPSLLEATIALRPYVFIFLAAFLVLAGRDLGWWRGAGWLAWGFAVALTAEYTSTRIGIPFGLYQYTGATAGREVFISNVPFFDPLSFPFLAYASFCLARGALRKPDGWAVTAGFSDASSTIMRSQAISSECRCQTSLAGPWWAASSWPDTSGP